MDQYNFGQLTKEIIASRLKGVGGAPALAADVVRKTITAGVLGTRASGQDSRLTVEEIIRGAMTGLVLIDEDLPEASVEILGRLAEAAQEIHVDPQDLMSWALEGMANVALLVSREAVWDIREAVGRKFMGAAEAFDKHCAKARERLESREGR